MGRKPGHQFRLDITAFDASVLPEGSRERGTPAFRKAVRTFVDRLFAAWGGLRTVIVDDREIAVTWKPQGKRSDPLDLIVAQLTAGDYAGGVTLLQLLLSERIDDVPILYNLGMALSDLGRLEEAERYLRQARLLDSNDANIQVALGVALARQEKLDEAGRVLRSAVEVDPSNLWALRNLGATLAKTGEMSEASDLLKRAVAVKPDDQQSWLGLAMVFEKTGKKGEADEILRRVIEIDGHSPFADIARERRSTTAHAEFRTTSRGAERMDAVFYCMGAIKNFANMPPDQVQTISHEIALLGMNGLDVNSSEQKYRLRSLPGQFSGLHLVAIMYTGFQLIDPSLDVGFDLRREFDAAKSLLGREKEASDP